jgi:hypothetical protein
MSLLAPHPPIHVSSALGHCGFFCSQQIYCQRKHQDKDFFLSGQSLNLHACVVHSTNQELSRTPSIRQLAPKLHRENSNFKRKISLNQNTSYVPVLEVQVSS